MSEQILLVDDELKVLKAYERNLSMHFDVAMESSPEQALMRLEHEGPFAVILTDYNMPRMNGNELLNKARELYPETVRIMLTGNADMEKTITAVNEGSVFRFLRKPCKLETLVRCLEDGLRQYQLITAERELLSKTLNGSIQVLMEILSILDQSVFSMAQRRRKAAAKVASGLNVPELWDIEMAAMLSDIGMVTLPEGTKERYHNHEKLSPSDMEMVLNIPIASSNLIKRIPRLDRVAEIIRLQNQDCGKKDIPIGARILRVVSEYFRIVSKGSTPQEALNILRMAPERFCSEVVNALTNSSDRFGDGNKAKKRIREVSISELKIGQVLKSDVRTANRMLILKANQVLGAAHLQRILNISKFEGVIEPITVEEE